MRWKGLWTKQASAESLGAVRLEAADEALRAAGAPRDVAALLIAAGYTSAPAFLRAPWGAKEANGRYESAEWRISVQPGCTAAALEAVRAFRDQLEQQAASKGSTPRQT